ncbi:hypothetical protein HanPSC8_Chr08g0314091 [Helianthus annuus]|nr:hypothetical protein HanPSC8_Chr08g0314091 [Helianthus annuus]
MNYMLYTCRIGDVWLCVVPYSMITCHFVLNPLVPLSCVLYCVYICRTVSLLDVFSRYMSYYKFTLSFI